jgi:ABC-2 type transport system permease protein
MNRTGAVARNELRILRRDPTFVIVMLVMPLVVMAFTKAAFRAALAAEGTTDANGAEQAVPGNAVLFGLFLVGNIGFTMFREHGWNTWERLRASWARPREVLAGKVAVPFATSLVQLTFLFTAGVLLLGLEIRSSVAGVVVVAAAFALALTGLGVALMSLCRSVMQLNAISNLFGVLLSGLGGALTPLSTLPGWARAIAPGTPSYWAMRGFRSAILPNGSFGDAAIAAAVLLGFAAAGAAIGLARFRVDESKVGWA